MSRILRQEHAETASERMGDMPKPTSEVLPGYKSGFSSLDSPITPQSKTGFTSPDLGSEFHSVSATKRVETDFGVQEVNVRVNQYYPGNRNYQNDKHKKYGWEQDQFPKYPELTEKSAPPEPVPSTSGIQRIVNVNNDVRPAVIQEPTFRVELTARALVNGCNVKNTMKQQLKTIFRKARPDEDRMHAAEGSNFDYRSKINPHVMPMPMIQATMSAARGGTERDHFNLRTNLSGIDENRFLNFDVQNEFNRRKWKENVERQESMNELERKEEEARREEKMLMEQQKRTEQREQEKAAMREAYYEKERKEEEARRYNEEMRRFHEREEYEKRRKDYEWAQKMYALRGIEGFLRYGPYDPNGESALEPWRG
jgi:hypothetical protein